MPTDRRSFTDAQQWRDQAACKGQDLDLFFPGPKDSNALARARVLCARCPVIDECRQEAERMPERSYGVWAGLTHAQRANNRRRLPVAGSTYSST